MATTPQVVRHVITIRLGGNYPKELKGRMDELKISQNDLAKQMKLSPSQVSRWFTSSERAVMPSLNTVQKIEKALLQIQLKRNKDSGTK